MKVNTMHNDVIKDIILKLEDFDEPIELIYENMYDAEIEAVCTYFTRQGFTIGYVKQEKVENYKIYNKEKYVTFRLAK